MAALRQAMKHGLNLAAVAALFCVIVAWGPNNPTGDIQPFGSSGGGMPGVASGPAGNWDWLSYTQTSSTGNEVHNGNVTVGGTLNLTTAYAGTYQAGQTTPIYGPLKFGNTNDPNSVIIFRPGQYSGPQLQFAAADASIGADLIPHRFITSNDMNLPQLTSLGLPQTGVYLPQGGGVQVRVGSNSTAAAWDTSGNLTQFFLLRMGGSTSAFPALKRNSATLAVRLADDSADGPLSAGTGTFSGNLSSPKLVLGGVSGIGLDAGATRLTNLATPTASTDAATKTYVDNASAGANPKIKDVSADAQGIAINGGANLGDLYLGNGTSSSALVQGINGAMVLYGSGVSFNNTSGGNGAVKWNGQGQLNFSRNVTNVTANTSVAAATPGMVYTNNGATGTVTFTLPWTLACFIGAHYTFAVPTGQQVIVTADSRDAIVLSSTNKALGNSATSPSAATAFGSYLIVQYVATNVWAVTGNLGFN